MKDLAKLSPAELVEEYKRVSAILEEQERQKELEREAYAIRLHEGFSLHRKLYKY